MEQKELERIFPLGPDSQPQPGVPEGRVEKYHFNTSRVFPGTERDYWVYVPAQYRAARPACLLVVQDGEAHLTRDRWKMATVLDNLIHQGAMPVTIGVFINPGIVPPKKAGHPTRNNRCFEYDSIDDRYARFLIDELLPEVEQRYRIRPDANSRAVMGASSGGCCAFNVAWQRPDQFNRVLSTVGSFTDQRGANAMISRVRQTEPKPLKVFLEGGAKDLDVVVGHWWTANQGMLAALQYADYEVDHRWHELAGHNDYHRSMVAPDGLRWLWHGWPKKVRIGRKSKQPVAKVLAPQKHWQAVEVRGRQATRLTVDAAGRLCWAAESDGTVRRLDASGRETVLARGVPGVTGLAFDQTGTLLIAQAAAKRILRLAGKQVDALASGVAATGLCADNEGGVYVAEPARNRVWYVAADGSKRVVMRDIATPGEVELTNEGEELLIASMGEDDVWATSVAAKGSLTNLEPFYHLIRDEGPAALNVVAMKAARPGWMCIASQAGVQLNNQNGICSGFIPTPLRGEALTGMTLAGPKGDQLYVSCGGRIFRRKIRLLPKLWLF